MPEILAGVLEVDAEGRVWRIGRRVHNRWTGEVLVYPTTRCRAENDAGAYLQVRSSVDRRRVHVLAHRLVWRTLRGQIPAGSTVNHKNGDKKDNRPNNLEIATYSEQMHHATRVLKRGHAANQRGEQNSKAKLSPRDVKKIRERRRKGEALLSIAKDFDVSDRTISKIARCERWTHV